MSIPPVPRELREYMTPLGRHVSRWFDDLRFAIDAVSNEDIGFISRTTIDTYASRTIQGTAGEIEVVNGAGITGDPVLSIPDVISTPRSFGTASNNTTFEADGTTVFNGEATVWKDIMFPQAPPKLTGAGNPTLATWNGNLRGYSYAVSDTHDFDPQEVEHDAKIGSEATWHIHFISRANDVDERRVRIQLAYAVEPDSGVVPSPTTVTAEFIIPAGTAVNTPFRENISTFTIGTIARLVYAKITRLAATTTDPSTDPIISGVHFHYQLDTVGSRGIVSK
jgi:hypothetical protein